MTEPQNTALAWNLEAAELAYGVIARYVEHAQISGVIIAMLASKLGEEGVKPLAQSDAWQSFMASKRSLLEAKDAVEQLTHLIDCARHAAASAAEPKPE